MKLFSKYNRINVLLNVTVFLLGCIAFAWLLQYVIFKQLDKDLEIEKNEIISYLKEHNTLPAIIQVHDQYTSYKRISNAQFKNERINTKQVFGISENEKEYRRIIEFDINANGIWYQVTVSKSLEGTEALIKTIITITVSLILIILLSNFIINRFLLRKLWQPFYTTLKSLQQFNLNNKSRLQFRETNIDEFKYLNSVLSNALNKAQQDYETLKEFTENAAHELQTPLAIIKSKLDNLIQDENLSESQSIAAGSAYEALNRLNKINQSLLLLAKIENQQFKLTRVDLMKRIGSRLEQFCELAQSRNIIIQSTLEASYINMNADLADILLNNLLSNAIRHNILNGAINVLLHKIELSISNTGAPQSLDIERMFTRFHKPSHNDGHGLGLSIVKQICDASGCAIVYQFRTPAMHSFTVSWNDL